MSIYIDGRDCCQTGQFSQDVADGALTVLADNPELILRVLQLRFDESLSYPRISAQTGVGLIGSCGLNGIDPEVYLRHILSVLPEWPSNRVDELLAWKIVLTDK